MINTAKSLSRVQRAEPPAQELTTVIREQDLVGLAPGLNLPTEIAIVEAVGPSWPEPLPGMTGTVRVCRAGGDHTADLPLFGSEDAAIDWLEKVTNEGGSGFCAFELPADVVAKEKAAAEAGQ